MGTASWAPVLVHRYFQYPRASATPVGLQIFLNIFGIFLAIWGAVALAAFSEANLQRIDLVSLLSIRVVHNDDSNLFQPFGILYVGEWCFRDRLAGILGQQRFGIETFHVTDAAAHEHPDDILCFWSEVGDPTGHHRATSQ